MPEIKNWKELFNEPKEIMSWAVFAVACVSLSLHGIDGWTVSLFGMSLVANGVVRIKSAGPSGVEFEDEDSA